MIRSMIAFTGTRTRLRRRKKSLWKKDEEQKNQTMKKKEEHKIKLDEANENAEDQKQETKI